MHFSQFPWILSVNRSLPLLWEKYSTHTIAWDKDGREGNVPRALEEGNAPNHLQYFDDMIIWGNTIQEVENKGKQIIRILLNAGFATKRNKVKGSVQEIVSRWQIEKWELSHSYWWLIRSWQWHHWSIKRKTKFFLEWWDFGRCTFPDTVSSWTSCSGKRIRVGTWATSSLWPGKTISNMCSYPGPHCN